jgi:hypothetical protein
VRGRPPTVFISLVCIQRRKTAGQSG